MSRPPFDLHPSWEPYWPDPIYRERKPTMRTAMKQASKAGVAVSGAIVRADGSIELTFGQSSGPDATANPWDEVLKNAPN